MHFFAYTYVALYSLEHGKLNCQIQVLGEVILMLKDMGKISPRGNT
jgi:hypothetical protein